MSVIIFIGLWCLFAGAVVLCYIFGRTVGYDEGVEAGIWECRPRKGENDKDN